MPVPIPTPFSEHGHIPMSWSSCNSLSSSESSSSSSYPEIIRELASKAPKPYGTIPPRRRKRRRKSILFEDPTTVEQCVPPIRIQRRMSHVEDWIKVDSKEPLPDDDELVSRSILVSMKKIKKLNLTNIFFNSLPSLFNARLLQLPSCPNCFLLQLSKGHMSCLYTCLLPIYPILQNTFRRSHLYHIAYTIAPLGHRHMRALQSQVVIYGTRHIVQVRYPAT